LDAGLKLIVTEVATAGEEGIGPALGRRGDGVAFVAGLGRAVGDGALLLDLCEVAAGKAFGD